MRQCNQNFTSVAMFFFLFSFLLMFPKGSIKKSFENHSFRWWEHKHPAGVSLTDNFIQCPMRTHKLTLQYVECQQGTCIERMANFWQPWSLILLADWLCGSICQSWWCCVGVFEKCYMKHTKQFLMTDDFLWFQRTATWWVVTLIPKTASKIKLG